MSSKTPTNPHHPRHPRPATAPAAPAAQPKGLQPLNWSYPFAAHGDNASQGPQPYFEALSHADDGFYPMGANGIWHGGIHFGAGTEGLLKQDDGVRAIADGEVVAYRLDTQYPTLDYPDGKKALYSTGFVLVRHRLVLPSAPGSSTSLSANDVLDFFSLYMHQLDWAGYQTAEKNHGGGSPKAETSSVRRMPFWKGDRHFRVGYQSADKQLPPLKSASEDPFIDDDFKPPATVPVAIGINIRDWANGNKIGLLPRGSEITIVGTATKGWARIGQILKGVPVGVTAGQPPAPHAVDAGWVYLDELALLIEPDPRDEVVVLDSPFPVKAGDVVGYMGHYLRYRDSSLLPARPTRPLLHLEVFAGDSFAAFIEKSRKRAEALPEDQKTMLVVSAGARLGTPCEPDQSIEAGLTLKPAATNPKSGRWAKVQPVQVTSTPRAHGHAPRYTETPHGNPLWVERSLSGQTTTRIVDGWKDFPLQLANAKAPEAGFSDVYSRAELGALEGAQDGQGVHWRLITVGTGQGESATGWVCEKNHPKTQWQSPWAWPGFEVVDNTSVPIIDAFKRYLYVTEQLLEGEADEFRPSALSVNGGALITKLEKAVDHLGDGDGTVTAHELAKAYNTPWLAKALSHLVIRYESEWGGDMSKWHALSSMMKNGKNRWQSELQRIEKLQWCDKVKAVEGFPVSPAVYHFHPVGLIGNFAKVDAAQALSENGMWFIFAHEAQANVSNRLHWPGNASGVTLGPGYDMKARIEDEIVADMKAIGLSDSVAAAISAGARKTGQVASDFAKNGHNLVSLTDDQQEALLRHAAKPYEAQVRNYIKVPLAENQFDALVSFAYNPAGRWNSVMGFINNSNVDAAMNKIREGNTSKGVVMKGLTFRRADEVTLYVNGRYEHNGKPLQSH